MTLILTLELIQMGAWMTAHAMPQTLPMPLCLPTKRRMFGLPPLLQAKIALNVETITWIQVLPSMRNVIRELAALQVAYAPLTAPPLQILMSKLDQPLWTAPNAETIIGILVSRATMTLILTLESIQMDAWMTAHVMPQMRPMLLYQPMKRRIFGLQPLQLAKIALNVETIT